MQEIAMFDQKMLYKLEWKNIWLLDWGCFIDNMQFMNTSLENLVKKLHEDKFVNLSIYLKNLVKNSLN